MKKLGVCVLLFFALGLFVSANNHACLDTLNLGGGTSGPKSSTFEQPVIPIVCDINYESGFIAITSTYPGAVTVVITGAATGEVYRKVFYDSTYLYLAKSDRYTIVFTLPSGATYSGFFEIN